MKFACVAPDQLCGHCSSSSAVILVFAKSFQVVDAVSLI